MNVATKILAGTGVLCLLLAGCTDTAVPPSTSKVDEPAPASYPSYLDTKAKAKQSNKPLLLVFTGSDWCDYSKALATDVLNTALWKEFAGESVITYSVDIPMATNITEEVLKQNKGLQKTWRVASFPTLLLLDSQNGEELTRCGYIANADAGTYIAKLTSALGDVPTGDGVTKIKLGKGDIRATTGTDKVVIYKTSGYDQGEWTMDLDAGIAAAKTANLPILLSFTKTEDCTWCNLMNENVLSQASWQRFARQNLILVALDFREKPPLPSKMKSRNEALQKQFGVQGYPTFVLVEPDGNTLVSYINHDLSPRGFRNRVEKALNLSSKAVNSASKRLSESDARNYLKTVKDLKAARNEKRTLDKEMQELFASGGVTAAFTETYRKAGARLDALEDQFEFYQRRVFAANLQPKTAQQYLRICSEIQQASGDLEKLRASKTADRDMIQAQEAIIRVAETRLEEIEVAHHTEALPADAADLYKRLFTELKLKRSDYYKWLSTDPDSDELNNAKDTLFQREINQLQDRMDAIRDLQSNKGGLQ